ncbi:MAG: hypothetical protein WCO09_01675 [bacterium]
MKLLRKKTDHSESTILCLVTADGVVRFLWGDKETNILNASVEIRRSKNSNLDMTTEFYLAEVTVVVLCGNKKSQLQMDIRLKKGNSGKGRWVIDHSRLITIIDPGCFFGGVTWLHSKSDRTFCPTDSEVGRTKLADFMKELQTPC